MVQWRRRQRSRRSLPLRASADIERARGSERGRACGSSAACLNGTGRPHWTASSRPSRSRSTVRHVRGYGRCEELARRHGPLDRPDGRSSALRRPPAQVGDRGAEAPPRL